MRELEKILEEIDGKIESYKENPRLQVVDICYGLNIAKRIIRKHINDGWIPVEERLPKAPEMEDEYPEFNVMIEGAKIPTTLQYSCDGAWIDDYGNVYNVIAWQPLPESYIPKMQDAKNNYEPEWKRNFRKKFERRM